MIDYTTPPFQVARSLVEDAALREGAHLLLNLRFPHLTMPGFRLTESMDEDIVLALLSSHHYYMYWVDDDDYPTTSTYSIVAPYKLVKEIVYMLRHRASIVLDRPIRAESASSDDSDRQAYRITLRYLGPPADVCLRIRRAFRQWVFDLDKDAFSDYSSQDLLAICSNFLRDDPCTQ